MDKNQIYTVKTNPLYSQMEVRDASSQKGTSSKIITSANTVTELPRLSNANQVTCVITV